MNKKITAISNTSESEENSDPSFQTRETIENQTTTNLVNDIDVVDTIERYFPNQGFEKMMKEALKKEHCESLRNARIICFEWKEEEGDKMTDFKGIDLALEKYMENSDAPMILTSYMDLQDKPLDDKRNIFNLLLSKPNVKFIRLPFDAEMLLELGNAEEKTGIEETVSEEAFQKMIEKEIGIFLHKESRYLPNHQDLNNIQILEILFFEKKYPDTEFENKIIGLLQMQYPLYKTMTREQNLARILDTYKFSMQKELPVGTTFSGVFVDRNGTLYDDEKKAFNPKVLEMIREYEAQGKEIVIRTLGDLESKQQELDKAGLNFTIQSKVDYKGAIVEIAIDDESPEKFYANTRVRAKEHIQI